MDLIFTSPPYADQRKTTYGGIHPDKYVEWFLPISELLLNVLRPTGTFVLNIKEKVINRFRDSWERLLQFNKERKFHMYQEAVMVSVGDWAKSRLKNLNDTDLRRDNAKNGSGFGKNVSNWIGRDMVYPTNVLHLATECSNKSHSAAFPRELPEWFIKLFTKEGDTVLDPFMGSGTTIEVDQNMHRNAIGIEIVPEYFNLVKKQVQPLMLTLFEPQTEYETTPPQ